MDIDDLPFLLYHREVYHRTRPASLFLDPSVHHARMRSVLFRASYHPILAHNIRLYHPFYLSLVSSRPCHLDNVLRTCSPFLYPLDGLVTYDVPLCHHIDDVSSFVHPYLSLNPCLVPCLYPSHDPGPYHVSILSLSPFLSPSLCPYPYLFHVPSPSRAPSRALGHDHFVPALYVFGL